MYKIILPLALLSAIVITAIAQTKNSMPKPSRKVGPTYFVDNNHSPAILSVAEVKDQSSYHYYLQLNDAATAAVIKTTKIFSQQEPVAYDQLVGCMDNNCWIYADSLVAYNMQTLEPVINQTMIAEKNPFMQNNFSKHANNYLLDEFAQVVYITADNGERYKLYTKDLAMKPDNSSSDVAPEEYRYEFAAEYKINDRYEMNFALTNIDTSGNQLYILGSDKETAQVIGYYGSAVYPDREELRQLSIIPFNKDGEKINFEKHPGKIQPKKYFKAGFLQQKFMTKTWRGSQNERIVLYNESIKNPVLKITMIDAAGNEKWTASTAFKANTFTDYLVNDSTLALWFNTTAGSNLVRIDLITGKVSSYLYQL